MKNIAILSIILAGALLTGCAAGPSALADETKSSTEPESSTTTIVFSGGAASISGTGAVFEDGVLTIDEAGVYQLSGTLEEGAIIVDAGGNDAVELVLDGLSATNSEGQVIVGNKASSLTITLSEGTENVLIGGTEAQPESEDASDEDTSGEDTSIEDTSSEEASDEDASGAAVWAKVPLTVGGDGALTVYGYVNNGIQSKKDLTVTGGTLTVTAAANGIKSNTDLTITGGDITVDSGGDALEAEGDLLVSGGSFDLTAGGGAENATPKTGDDFGMMSFGTSNDDKTDGMPSRDQQQADGQASDGSDTSSNGTTLPDGVTLPEDASGEMSDFFSQMQQNRFDATDFANMDEWSEEDDDTVSTKGVKADGSITITGGSFTIDTCDDAVHANVDITIDGGTFLIHTGDDGMHADSILTVNGGSIDIQECYEGLEGAQVIINGGDTQIRAGDDGVNASDGSSQLEMMGNFSRMNGSTEASATEQTTEAQTTEDEAGDDETLEVLFRMTGGSLSIMTTTQSSTGGDGIDSNGSIYLEGGVITVSTAASAADSAIDYGSESGGELVITSGEILAVGSSNMAEEISEDSTQCSALLTLDEAVDDGTELLITDAEGNVIFSFTPEHGYDSVLVSSANFQIGQTYTLTAGTQTQDFTFEQTVVNQGTGVSMGAMGGNGDGNMPSFDTDSKMTEGMPSFGTDAATGATETSGAQAP